MDNKSSDLAVKVECPKNVENKEMEQVKQPTEPTVKKNVKEEKSRKKDDKSVEQVLKALNSLETTEEKLAAMCKKYSDIVDENRKLQLAAKQTEKRLSIIQREKEQLQTEHSKAVLTRSRLESLCRELQRQNKAIKDESLLKIREEEEKRKEVSAKFQSTLNEITALMQQNNEKNSKLREDNLEMTKKFKTVCEQYELREQQVEKITKQMQLEAQLSDAKLAKAKMEMAAEKEILLKEKQQLLMDLTEYQAKCQELQTTEINLRSQISLYTDKYDEFQNALSRSNEVFGGFKGEMEKMSKKICKLEKETSSWKQRWEKSHQALLEMAADKQQRDSELALATRQLAQLQKLCRTLQAERTSLLAQLKSEGAAKVGDSVGKGDAPIESLHQSQNATPKNSTCSLNTSCSDTCKHESEKQHVLQNQDLGSSHCEKIEVVRQNDPSPSEGTLADLIVNANQISPVSESHLSSILNEHITKDMNILSEVLSQVTNEQICMNDASLNCTMNTTECSHTLSQDSIDDHKELLINNEPEVQNRPETINSQAQSDKDCTSFPISISSAEEQKSAAENTKESILTPVTTLPTNEHISVDCTKTVHEECQQDPVLNGQLPELIINSTIVANEQNLDQPSLEKKMPDVTEVQNDINHIAENGEMEQMPVKPAATDIKKAKEGGKKRKNK